MESLQICGVGLLTAVAALIVRQLRGELAIPIRLSGSVVLMAVILGLLAPICVYLEQLAESTGLGDCASVLLRAFGVAMLTQLGAELCRDCGEGTVASCLELAGRCEILLLSMPLISSVLDTARELLSWT